jgi:protein TonB
LVVLRAIINRDGAIENLQALSGHPLLVPAALNAVRQWRYRPYVLNGEPVEVETEVKVNFILSGG